MSAPETAAPAPEVKPEETTPAPVETKPEEPTPAPVCLYSLLLLPFFATKQLSLSSGARQRGSKD